MTVPPGGILAIVEENPKIPFRPPFGGFLYILISVPRVPIVELNEAVASIFIGTLGVSPRVYIPVGKSKYPKEFPTAEV